MNRFALIFLFALIAIVGCENLNDDSQEYEEAIAMVESFTVDTTFNKTATISLNCFAPTPCWSFSRIIEQRDSNEIHLTVYRKEKKYQTCVQVVSSFVHTMNISVTNPGSYTIKIYRTPTTTLDTTITL